jgi:hypothetical protein
MLWIVESTYIVTFFSFRCKSVSSAQVPMLRSASITYVTMLHKIAFFHTQKTQTQSCNPNRVIGKFGNLENLLDYDGLSSTNCTNWLYSKFTRFLLEI